MKITSRIIGGLIMTLFLISSVYLKAQSEWNVSIDPDLWARDTIGSKYYRHEVVQENWLALEKLIGNDTSELKAALGMADFVCTHETNIPQAIKLLRPSGQVWLYLFENYLYGQDYSNFVNGQSCSKNHYSSSYIFFLTDDKGKVTHIFKYMSGG